MSISFPTALLALSLLFSASPEAAVMPDRLDCAAARLLIRLEALSTTSAPEVCISRGLATTLFFDAPLISDSVELQGAGHFAPLDPGRSTVALLLQEELEPGTRLKVTVHFVDGAAPSRASFVLVVHPSRAIRQVMVSRQIGAVEFCEQQVQQARLEEQQCQDELARVRAKQGTQGGLRGLLAEGLMVVDRGVKAGDVSQTAIGRSRYQLRMASAHAYQAEGRVALDVWLLNEGTQNWSMAEVTLTGPQGEVLELLSVWEQESLLGKGQKGRMVVEALTESPVQGLYTLTLLGQDGVRAFILERVVFPPL
jgi:uncharacterized protein (TIGR02268 family)